METLKAVGDALWYTPWWVYLIFVYCVKVGLKSAQPGVVSIWKMMIIPLVFVGLSLESVFSHYVLSSMVLSTYAMALGVGILLGWYMVSRLAIDVDRDKKLLRLPGGWSTMVIIMIIFFSKYYLGYEMSQDPEVLTNTHFEILSLAVMGVTAGMFVGRLLGYAYCLRTQKSVSLTTTD